MFRSKLKRKYVILGDTNRNVGRDVNGYEGVHGRNGFRDRNAEGEAILEFATCFGFVVNTFLTTEIQKLMTYELAEVRTVVDYMLS